MVTSPIDPVATLANRSQPSSALYAAIQPSKTLPTPDVILAANPSASSIAESALFIDVQFRM